MAPVIWRCEVVSIVDSAISDAATAVSKVASSDSRIIDHRSGFVGVGGWDKEVVGVSEKCPSVSLATADRAHSLLHRSLLEPSRWGSLKRFSHARHARQ